MKDKINVGLASFGMSGEIFHAPLLHIHPGFRLKAICERTKNKAVQKYPDIITYRSFDEMLRDPDIDLVVVNVPDYLHFPMAINALKAGKHVIVEKPFTVKTDEAVQLIKAARRQNLLLSVYQNRRWDGGTLTVKQILAEKLLGRLVSFESHLDRFRNYLKDSWKDKQGTGTGSLYNLGSHLIDESIQFFGLPEKLYAEIGSQRTDCKVDDYFFLTLYYQGMQVYLRSSYLVREPGPRYILHGTEGSYIKMGNDPQEEALKAGRLPNEKDWGKEPYQNWGILNTTIEGTPFRGRVETLPGNYTAYYDNIYAVLQKKSELIVKPEQAMQVIRIIELAYQSAKEGRIIPFTDVPGISEQ